VRQRRLVETLLVSLMSHCRRRDPDSGTAHCQQCQGRETRSGRGFGEIKAYALLNGLCHDAGLGEHASRQSSSPGPPYKLRAPPCTNLDEQPLSNICYVVNPAARRAARAGTGSSVMWQPWRACYCAGAGAGALSVPNSTREREKGREIDRERESEGSSRSLRAACGQEHTHRR
jgi:hypothetical protein